MKSDKPVIQKIGTIALFTFIIGVEMIILFSRLNPVPKITLSALFVFLVCALFVTAAERKKQNEEFEKKMEEYRNREAKRGTFKERVARFKKENES